MNLLVLPILIPLLTAISCLMVWRKTAWQRYLGVLGSFLLLAGALLLLKEVWDNGIQVVQIGTWSAPFGITLVADLLSALMVVINGLMGTSVALYSLGSMDKKREVFGYYPLLQILLMGISGAFLTGDLFNLYVWFEVMLIASFVLLALGNEPKQMEGAIKYVTINLISSALFLTAVGVLYGMVATLNMADLSVKLSQLENPKLALIPAMLFLTAFGIKAAIFPLFFWLPASYHTPPAAISAIFAGMLTKVGVYALIRSFTLIFVQDTDLTHNILLVLATLTMLTGVLGAASQFEFRRILSFHIISQIGYMVLGLALYTPLALLGSIFYIAHHIIVKTNLFLVSGITHRLTGSYDLEHLGGLYKRHPWVTLLFAIPAFSLAGMPPLSGFFAKLFLIKAGLEVQQYFVVGIALLVGLLTLFSMTKIWAEAFWKSAPKESRMRSLGWKMKQRDKTLMLIPITSLAIITLCLGLGAEGLFKLSKRAANQLLNPQEYIQKVLGNNKAYSKSSHGSAGEVGGQRPEARGQKLESKNPASGFRPLASNF